MVDYNLEYMILIAFKWVSGSKEIICMYFKLKNDIEPRNQHFFYSFWIFNELVL